MFVTVPVVREPADTPTFLVLSGGSFESHQFSCQFTSYMMPALRSDAPCSDYMFRRFGGRPAYILRVTE